MLKTILKNLGYTFLSIILITFILNIFYYFNLIPDKLMNILMIISSLICFLVGSVKFKKNDKSKCIISSLKIGSIYSLILLIVTFIFFSENFKIFNLIYYLLILLASLFGCMIGSNNPSKN